MLELHIKNSRLQIIQTAIKSKKGDVLSVVPKEVIEKTGITRIGIISEKYSILARASFETPIKHFVNATIKGQKDELASVIENVILNQPVPVGTGLPGLLVKVTGKLSSEKEKSRKDKE